MAASAELGPAIGCVRPADWLAWGGDVSVADDAWPDGWADGEGGEPAEIAAASAGDGEAFARLVRRYQRPIARQMWRFTRDPGQLEELVQEVFVQTFYSLGRYRGDGPFGHWLRRIAVRVGYRFWQRRDRERRHRAGAAAGELDAAAVAATVDPDRVEAAEAAELVHAVLGELRPAERLVLTLMHLEQRSVAEVAELTGWTRGAVKVRAHRARGRLAKLLKEKGWDQ